MKNILLILTVIYTSLTCAQNTIEKIGGEITELMVYDLSDVKVNQSDEHTVVVLG